MTTLYWTDPIDAPGLGRLGPDCGMTLRANGGDGLFRAGRDGVQAILLPADEKVEFIVYSDRTLAYVRSMLGHPGIYPVPEVRIDRPVEAVLMDLDGTSVHSEAFWIWIIEQTTASLLGDKNFSLEEADLPFVSGHSVSEHLQHCLNKYCPDRSIQDARKWYFEHTEREMKAILDGGGRQDAFTPTPGLKEFLLELKGRGVKLGLVTSGLYEKAWPEILSAFRQLGMGDPAEFYDAIITAGFQVGRDNPGTLGELSPKPHPWLYAETAAVGLGITPGQRHRVIGVEDSGAGVVSIRLAGYSCVGMAGGNIDASGTRALTDGYCSDFNELLKFIDG